MDNNSSNGFNVTLLGGIMFLIIGIIIALASETIGYFFAAIMVAVGVFCIIVGAGSKASTGHYLVAGMMIAFAIIVFGMKSCSNGLDKRPRHHRHHYDKRWSGHSHTKAYLVKFDKRKTGGLL